MQWPEQRVSTQTRMWTLDILHFQHEKGDGSGLHAPGQEWLFHYVIPPFQRELVWDEARMVKFIESAALGLHLGTWVYNNTSDAAMVQVGGRRCFDRTDRWLIDGQQRLSALKRFWDDDLVVFGQRWCDLSGRQKNRFLSTPFPADEISTTDEMELRALYDRLNFGGVSHTEDQRALPDEGAPSPGP